MKTFFRIFNDKLYGLQMENIGFSSEDPSYIPDEYLEKEKFMVMRTCHGIGDWVLLSAMPRLLKNKYPNCKVYLPSKILLEKIFGNMLNNWGYGTFTASDVVKHIFENNPYVDEFVDSYNDEIFHDHYKIFNPQNDRIPLLKQMLNFWQFKDNEMEDVTPDFYPTNDELEWFNNFNKFSSYGYISVSSTFGDTAKPNDMLKMIKDEHIQNWYFYSESNIEDSIFNFIPNAVQIKPLSLSIRQQQLLKINAKVNYGNETGMNIWTAKYSDTYILNNQFYGPVHGGKNEGKKRKRPFKTGNFVERVVYV